MYPNEFPPEPPPPVIDPTLLAMLVLLVVAVAALCLWLGQYLEARGAARRSEDAADGIWQAVNKVANAANDARGDGLIGKAGELRQTIDRELGPVRLFGGDLAREAGALGDALDGKADDGHGGSTHDTAHEEHSKGSTISIHHPSKVVIRNGEPANGDHGTHDDHGPGEARLSPREVREAVTNFREWWGDKAARIAELRRAQAALNGGPLPK